MINNEIIRELDSTSATTGLKNYFGRKKDAALGALGSHDAVGRQNTRMVADELYKRWRTFTGEQGIQGNGDELGQFIYRQFGGNPAVMSGLRQQFPQVFGAQTGQPAQQAGQQTNQQQQTAQQTPDEPAAQIDDNDSMTRFQNYQKRINRLLQVGMRSGIPDSDKIMRSVNSMLRSFADTRRSDKARSWVKNYVDRSLKPHADIVPDLGMIGDDPFAQFAKFTRNRRTPVPSIPPAPAAPPGPPDMSQPPDFLRRQQNPPNPGPPPPRGPMHTPPAYKERTAQRPDMEHPPGFLRRQRSEPTPPEPRSETWRPVGRLIEQEEPYIPKRAEVDKIFIALARILMTSGEATVNRRGRAAPAQATANPPQNATQQQQQQQTAQRPSAMAARITPEALGTVGDKVQLTDSEASQLQGIIANQPTLSDILKTTTPLSNAMVAALVYAAESMG